MRIISASDEDAIEYKDFKSNLIIKGNNSEITNRYLKLIENSAVEIKQLTRDDAFTRYVMENEIYIEQFDEIFTYFEEKTDYIIGTMPGIINFYEDNNKVIKEEIITTNIDISLDTISERFQATKYYIKCIVPKVTLLEQVPYNAEMKNLIAEAMNNNAPLNIICSVLNSSLYFDDVVLEYKEPEQPGTITDFDKYVTKRMNK